MHAFTAFEHHSLNFVIHIRQFYRVILLVSDLIDRLMYRDFMNLILLRLEFEAAIADQVNIKLYHYKSMRIMFGQYTGM